MSEKTEAPSPKRLREARDKGQVSRSQDLVTAGVLLLSVYVIRYTGPDSWRRLEDITRGGLGPQPGEELTVSATMAMFREFAIEGIFVMLPILAAAAIAGVVLNAGQGGLVFSTQPLTPKFNRINPMAGMKRIFSKDGAVNLVKSIAKMGVVAIVVWMVMRDQMSQITIMGHESVPLAAAHMAKLGFDIALRGAAVLLILGLADYAWQRRQFLNNLKMTKEEVKKEMKESDGDPFIKSKIRQRRQQMMSRMMEAVPTADVVVMNPTHFAVALKYDPITMAAPVVVAKGQDLIALRIRAIAERNGVPVLEEPPLARALFKAVQVDHPIPANLFHAVAEVLAWVYAIRTRKPYRWSSRPAPAGA